FWDVATRQQQARPPLPHAGLVSLVAFRSDGQLLTFNGTDYSVRVWDKSDSPLGTALPHLTWLQNALFSPDRRSIATVDNTGIVRVGGAAPAAPTFVNLFQGVLSYGPDGRVVVGRTADGKLQVSQIVMHRPLLPLGRPIDTQGPVSHIQVSRDG